MKKKNIILFALLGVLLSTCLILRKSEQVSTPNMIETYDYADSTNIDFGSGHNHDDWETEEESTDRTEDEGESSGPETSDEGSDEEDDWGFEGGFGGSGSSNGSNGYGSGSGSGGGGYGSGEGGWDGNSGDWGAEEGSDEGIEEADPPEEIVDAIEVSIEYPQFPWPPPKPSSFASIPKRFLNHCENLDDINELLTEALDSCGYYERSYFQVPHGFALITRIEQINTDGTSKKGSSRWSLDPEIFESFDLLDYIRAVFYSSPGYFRVLVFVVSDEPFPVSSESLSESEALDLLDDGLHVLPPELADITTSPATYCTGLIYEFEKPEEKDTSYVILPGKHIGQTHLTKSFILPKINSIYESRNDFR